MDPISFPDPAERRRMPTPPGRLVLAGGEGWVFALEIPALGPAWDRLYEQGVWRECYEPLDVFCGAILLLQANYRVTEEEAADLVRTVPLGTLVEIIHTALFGVEDPDITFSDWVLSAFYANGLNPATIPAEYRMLVMRQLAGTGRCVSEAEFVSARRAAVQRGNLPTVADVLKIRAIHGEMGGG